MFGVFLLKLGSILPSSYSPRLFITLSLSSFFPPPLYFSFPSLLFYPSTLGRLGAVRRGVCRAAFSAAPRRALERGGWPAVGTTSTIATASTTTTVHMSHVLLAQQIVREALGGQEKPSERDTNKRHAHVADDEEIGEIAEIARLLRFDIERVDEKQSNRARHVLGNDKNEMREKKEREGTEKEREIK